MSALGKLSARFARVAWPALLVTAVVAFAPGISHAYVVAPGSTSNQFHLTLDDRAGLTHGAKIEASVQDAPSWIQVSDAHVDAARGIDDVVIGFDVSAVAPGTVGSFALQIRGTDSAGRVLFERSRRVPLTAGTVKDGIQRSYDVQQCCIPLSAVHGGSSVPSTLVLVGNSPNPFGPTTSIVFGLPAQGGAVSLTIFDVGGRTVRSISTPALSGGYHQINWDGRTDGDRVLAPGTYFYRLSSGSWSAAGKMQLLR